MNDAAMNIHKQVSVWTHVFSSLGYTPKSTALGSCGDSMFNKNDFCNVDDWNTLSPNFSDPKGISLRNIYTTLVLKWSVFFGI